MFTDVDWTYRGHYIAVRHGVSAGDAEEALRDPGRLVLDPDPSSRSRRSVRVVGWSSRQDALLTVIVVERNGHEYWGERLALQRHRPAPIPGGVT